MTVRKTMLLTGASRGIGHATVKHFNAAGWRVLTVSRQPFNANCPWPEGRDSHIQLDLTDIGSLDKGVQDIRERLSHGRIDAIVNNAGISPKLPGGERMGVLDSSYETWSTVFNVNLFSIALLARGLFPELSAARGIVVNVTSIVASRHPHVCQRRPRPGRT